MLAGEAVINWHRFELNWRLAERPIHLVQIFCASNMGSRQKCNAGPRTLALRYRRISSSESFVGPYSEEDNNLFIRRIKLQFLRVLDLVIPNILTWQESEFYTCF